MEGEREMSLEGRVVASGTVGERGRGPEQGNGWRRKRGRWGRRSLEGWGDGIREEGIKEGER